MDELQREINDAYNTLAVIPVAGDYIEVMAEAREHLRRAYKLSGLKQEEAESNG